MLNMFRVFSLFVLISSFCTFSAYATTPEEYCRIHEESGAPGTCTAHGDCAVLTTNLGTEECKLCSEGGCELVNSCNECSE